MKDVAVKYDVRTFEVPFKASWSLPVNNSVTDVEKKFVLNLYDNSLVLLFDKSQTS